MKLSKIYKEVHLLLTLKGAIGLFKILMIGLLKKEILLVKNSLSIFFLFLYFIFLLIILFLNYFEYFCFLLNLFFA